MRKRLVIDLSSVIWTSLRAGKDKENGRTVDFDGKPVLVNSAAYGRENALNMITGAWKRFGIVPMDTIAVYEGKNTKALRIAMYAGYKGGKDAPKSQPPEAYEEFNKLKAMLLDDLRILGGHAVTQDNVEGDDIFAYILEHLDGERIGMTGDGDLTILNQIPGVKIWRNGEFAENPYGPFPFYFITLYKALVGDTSDQIKGAKGFGEKTWLDLLCGFGDEGLEALDMLVRTRRIKELAEDVPEMKALQKIIDSEDDVYRCYAAASLHPECVNTLRNPLRWQAGYTGMNSRVKSDERLKGYAAATPRLVNTDNYDVALKFLADKLADSPFVALDIETATPEESDEWLMRLKGLDADSDLGVDVFGSELVGLGLTFGPNMQYSFYFTTEHLPDADRNRNLSPLQILAAVRLIPKGTEIIVQNSLFELPILYMTWGQEEKDNGWHGYLPNVVDTLIMSSFVDENVPTGLKQNSKLRFDYDQVSYTEVAKGRKMHMIPAEEVLLYGCDDTIMTAGLYNFYSIIMEIEGTMRSFRESECLAAYVFADKFVRGVNFNYERMKEIQSDDDAIHAASWAKVRDYIISIGFQGSVCPTFVVADLLVPAKIKEMYALCIRKELETKVRTPDKLFKLIADSTDDEWEGTSSGGILSYMMSHGQIDEINAWARKNFTGEPIMDFDSTKVMRSLLYDTFKLPVRLVNKVTDTEREARKELEGLNRQVVPTVPKDLKIYQKRVQKLTGLVAQTEAVYKFKKILNGSESTELTAEEYTLLGPKAKTDAKAVGFALLYEDGTPQVRDILRAIQIVKTVETRRKLFYVPYKNVRHWKDNKLHSSVRQVGTVTRRPSVSAPNENQLPKRNEGLLFRECFVPHTSDAVIVSIDFDSQELRLQADKCRDPNFLSCFIGDNKRKLHDITASSAMRRRFGEALVDEAYKHFAMSASTPDADYHLFRKMKEQGSPWEEMADDLYKGSKNTNFAAGYGAEAPKLAETLIMPVEDAALFLEANKAMLPGFENWKEEVKSRIRKTGYGVTYLGARRHLASGILNENKWEVEGALRQGPNYEIQGSAAEQTKLAMSALWKSGFLFKYDMRFVANIYDELVISVATKDVLPVVEGMMKFMTQKYMDVVPEVASISLGPSFGEQYEAGTEFDREVISAILNRVRQQHALPMAA